MNKRSPSLFTVLIAYSQLITVLCASDQLLYKRKGPQAPHDLNFCRDHCHHGTCEVDQTALHLFGGDAHDLVHCKCDMGWVGIDCEHDFSQSICGTRMCIHGRCGLGGQLVGRAIDDPACICAVGFTGDQCDREEPRIPCGPHRCLKGICHPHDHCTCDPGWDGPDCDIGGEICGHDHCLHGNCISNQHGESHCDCDPHWSGRNCDIPWTHCDSGPCYYGHCVHLATHFSACLCDPNWEGNHCENYTHPSTIPTTLSPSTPVPSTPVPTISTTTTQATTTAKSWVYNVCDKAQVVSILANQLISTDARAYTCQTGTQTSPSALVLSICNVSEYKTWTPGMKVVDDCSSIPPFTPIASFPSTSGYIADGGLCGVFLGCLPDGFKMASQNCDSAANITHIVTGGVFNHNPNVYYTIQ